MGNWVWKITKVIAMSLIGLIVISFGSGFAYRSYRHNQINNATAIDTATGVDEGMFVRIGGIDQWLSIRGQLRDNPVVLFLHGGPGLALSPVPRTYFFEWTRHFTVVQWDQRGAGKTFGRSGPVDAAVTIKQIAQDGVEVADWLRTRLHKPKI